MLKCINEYEHIHMYTLYTYNATEAILNTNQQDCVFVEEGGREIAAHNTTCPQTAGYGTT